MEDRNILSKEEVDAIIKSSISGNSDAEGEATNDDASESESSINTNALANIIENLRESLESKLTALLRKKIVIKPQPVARFSIEELQQNATEGAVYSTYKFNPISSSTLIVLNGDLLDMMLTMLYGGKLQQIEEGNVKIGKVGLIAAEKIGGMINDSLITGMKEYGELSKEPYKTSQLLQTVNTFANEIMHCIEMKICIDEVEKTFRLCLPEEFLIKFIPFKTGKGKGKHKEKDFWRTAIKQEVMDSFVTITVNMADIKMPLSRLLSFKEGDEIEVADPALVYACLNDLKIYRALAGQSNSNIVVKIISQV